MCIHITKILCWYSCYWEEKRIKNIAISYKKILQGQKKDCIAIICVIRIAKTDTTW